MTKYSFFPKYWQKFTTKKNHWHHPLDDDYEPIVDEGKHNKRERMQQERENAGKRERKEDNDGKQYQKQT